MYTRSGKEVAHMKASYGRAAREESKRKRRKRKLLVENMLLALSPDDAINSTPARRTRSQWEQETALDTPPSATNRVSDSTSREQKRSERISRKQQTPRCSDFGHSRHFSFEGQGLLFCNPCDLWDALLPDCSAKVSVTSRTFACTAEHTAYSHPTSVRRTHWTALPSLAEDSLEDKEVADDDSSSYNSDGSISMILRQQNVHGEDKDASGSHSQSDSESEVLHSSDQPVQQLDQTTDQETLRLFKQKEEELRVMTG